MQISLTYWKDACMIKLLYFYIHENYILLQLCCALLCVYVCMCVVDCNIVKYVLFSAYDARLQPYDHVTSQGTGPAGLAPPPSHMTKVYAAIQLDRSVRMWRMNADRVRRHFLQYLR